MVEIVAGRGRRRQMQHPVEGAVEGDRPGHVDMAKDEAARSPQCRRRGRRRRGRLDARPDQGGEVVEAAGEQRVVAPGVVAVRDQALAEMGAEEAGPTGDKNLHRATLTRWALTG